MNLCHSLYANRDAESTAFRFLDGREFSTRFVREQVARYAAALATLGVGPGDRVSFKVEKCLEVIFLAHACFQLGAIVHPLNTAYTDSEVDFLLADAQPRLFVCEPAEMARLAPMAARVGAVLQTLGGASAAGLAGLAAQQVPRREFRDVGPDATAAILYTSGTTGQPKGAQITHANLAESAAALAAVWRIGAADTLLHALPVYHAHGLLTAINTMLVGGGSVLFLPGFESGEVLAALPAVTVMMGVPTHYARLLKESRLAAAIGPRFRLAISGSAPLPPEVARAFAEVTGHTLVERYGSTEAAIVTAVPCDAKNASGTVGWPLPGVQVRVVAPGGHRQDRGTGELETRGHNVFSGYWRRPDADLQAFTADGWFVTGDIAEIRGDGCVRLLDRAKDLVISGGLNVYPREVEGVLDALPGVGQSAVFGVPHPDFGEAVAAVIELQPGAAFDEAALLAAARTKLARYKVPKRILVTDEIPRNRMSKVLKAALRAEHRHLFAASSGAIVQAGA